MTSVDVAGTTGGLLASLKLPDDELIAISDSLERDRRASRAFRFPYDVAYGIQLDLMRAVFQAIEEGKVGIFESPTGTGKSLSLICGACSWLERNAEREAVGMGSAGDDEPEWVRQHAQRNEESERMNKEAELRDRLARARRRLQQRRLANDTCSKEDRKRRRQEGLKKDQAAHSDDEFALDPYNEEDYGDSKKPISAADADDPASFLNPEVRVLMEQTGAYLGSKEQAKQKSQHRDQDKSLITAPKIIFASRTHSQLSQFIGELKRTPFSTRVPVLKDGNEGEGFIVRSISLGSRKQMCINENVIQVGERAGTEAMNERCLDLMKASSASHRCRFLPPSDSTGEVKMFDYRDDVLSSVHDIEETVKIGRDGGVCPYFGARGAAQLAHIVTLPYNLLLNATARASLDLDLKDSIVIIDEAHNLIDTILASHTVVLSSEQVIRAIGHIEVYAKRFSLRLKGSNEMHLKTLKQVLFHIRAFCQQQEARGNEALTTTAFIRKLGGNVDQVNLTELERWLRSSKIARKVAGYITKKAEEEAATSTDPVEVRQRARSQATSALHAIEAFLLSLTNGNLDGRIFVTVSGGESTGKGLTLKYQLLNPSIVFDPIVQEARAVVLAGGTMEPVAELESQLFPDLDRSRFMRFSCSHIIPPQNLFAGIICAGAKGKRLEFKFDARHDAALLDELSNLLINYCNVIPYGLVVFVPSYSFLETLQQHWKQGQGALPVRISAKKRIFFEPKEAIDVDRVLNEYGRAIDSATTGQPSQRNGAILFAVVGAKLSEGINFSDRLARAVIMVGMPFANANSPELAERMRYVRRLPASVPGADPGQELYVNLCMKAVNQSIGRAIRHKDDFAALLFLDCRYARPDIQARLPRWIRQSTSVYNTFGPSMAALGQFFRGRKATTVA